MKQPAGGAPRGTLLAFDYGSRRIGVAVGELSPPTASAFATIGARNGQPQWEQLDQLIEEWRPVALIVGIPHHADGSESPVGAAAREFGAALEQHYSLPIHFVDESLTSRQADAELREKRKRGMLRRRVRRDDSDRIAARLILESWLARNTEQS
ncbi:MAG: Holliday junction resolvase RuvX [Gammaproteobacteria bacterium]|nr:Holliday junction resolvase RuvX [Gammaproteobacteria bacterium]NNF61022.1 Holliday junction resolvase RuvX [Gammaproteobacteria bacterium]NNM21890.1 Holliday junction resolvase RuvX [Gammaproteobacteria bacterium]